MITELQKRGYTFLAWDGRDFAAARGGSAGASAAPTASPR